jgi:D-amino-acid dehydrogenase
MAMGLPIVVIGAGICGVSSALWLQRSGHRVILIDKTAPGMGASFGNAGLLAQWAVTPVTTPDLWQALPKYALNPASPFIHQMAISTQIGALALEIPATGQ